MNWVKHEDKSVIVTQQPIDIYKMQKVRDIINEVEHNR